MLAPSTLPNSNQPLACVCAFIRLQQVRLRKSETSGCFVADAPQDCTLNKILCELYESSSSRYVCEMLPLLSLGVGQFNATSSSGASQHQFYDAHLNPFGGISHLRHSPVENPASLSLVLVANKVALSLPQTTTTMLNDSKHYISP